MWLVIVVWSVQRSFADSIKKVSPISKLPPGISSIYVTRQRLIIGFGANRPDYVFLVAGTVGGILANSTRPAEFIYDNMMIHATVVHAAYLYQTKKLLYLGSSCIYPRECQQPMKEEYLLTNILEPTNESYAIAKIAGIKLCQAYRRQYGCNFISAMPTNLYGPNDNFDLESSHVLPALIRKFHLAKLATQGNWETIEKDERFVRTLFLKIFRGISFERF